MSESAAAGLLVPTDSAVRLTETEGNVATDEIGPNLLGRPVELAECRQQQQTHYAALTREPQPT